MEDAGVAERLAAVRERVAAAARSAGRDPAEVRILLAVKTQSARTVRAAVTAGGTLLGHNRAQELLAMAPDLADLAHEMHFIGHLQSNKVTAVLPWVTCVQTVDTLDLAGRLSRAAERADRVLDVLLQVNTSRETTKSGAHPALAADLAYAVATLPHLRLTGWMTIGANTTDAGAVRASFERLATIRAEVGASGVAGTENAIELSMGMSADLDLAIAAGATIVRIGSAVFGPRPLAA